MFAIRILLRGCLCVAPFLFPTLVIADAPTLPRVDIIACAKAVDGLDDHVRSKMQSHCLVLAGNTCEAPASGPILACLDDLSETMGTYVQSNKSLLPAAIESGTLRAVAYTNALKRLGMDGAEVARCERQHSKAFDRAICLTAARFGRLVDLLNAARYAGVALPYRI